MLPRLRSGRQRTLYYKSSRSPSARKEISRKYKLTAKASENLDPLSATDINPTIVALENRMKQLAIKRQKGSQS
jgi:hypothetical protein